MLVIRTAYDAETSLSYEWANRILAIFPAAQALNGPQVTSSAVTSALQRHTTVAFYGHGTFFALLGHEDHPVITLATAILRRLRGKILIATACSSSRILGWFAVRAGARAYLGYLRPFNMFADAAPVLAEIVNEPMRQMGAGARAEQALDACRQQFEQKIDYYLTGGGQNIPNAPGIAAALAWNLDGLSLRGDRTATLQPGG
jgi:hypothetical protein